MSSSQSIPYAWIEQPWAKTVQMVCLSWAGTPYMAGQRCKGRAVDCLHFTTGFLDDLYGCTREAVAVLRGDLGLHDREGALAALKAVVKLYPMDPVEDGTLEAGDMIWTGPANGGPAHALVVSGNPGVLYHAPGIGLKVQSTAFAFDPEIHQKLRVLRPVDKDTWRFPPC